MKLFDSKVIRNIDAQTIKLENITSLELMERAASAVTDEITARWAQSTPVIVFAGKGNNGGDGLAIARMLIRLGYDVTTYLFNPSGGLSEDCDANRQALFNIEGAKLIEVCKSFNMPVLEENHLVIDAIFGTGLNTPVSGGFGALIQSINDSEAFVVSIDMPSGLFGEDNHQNDKRNIVRADITLSFQFPKLSFMFSESERYTGEVVILDIDLSREAIAKTYTKYHYTEKNDAASLLKKRSRFANKGDFGKALIVAGSYGMMGAAQLCAKACLHSGVGLLTVHSPSCGYDIMQSAVPEAKFQADENETHVSYVPDIYAYSHIAVGPGLSTDSNCTEAVKTLLSQLNAPCVLDADALNIISANRELLGKIPANSIITPHPKEFDRLFGKSEYEYHRLQKGIDAARQYGIIIILKGAHSAVILPSGEVHFNSTGNPGMATGGSGDVLTGILLSLLCQKYTPSKAAILGTYIHGLSADLALSITSAEALSPTDIIQHLGHAFRQLNLVS